MPRLLGRLLIAGVVAGGLFALWSQSTATGKPVRSGAFSDDEQALPQSAHKVMGTATCASMSCHNVNGPRGSKRSEYSTWAAFDKHAHAFDALYDERSERIARNLYGENAHAYEQQACLNCHSMKHESVPGVGPRFHLADGVSCESCHGAAEHWLASHYQTGFKEKSDQEKMSYGMAPTKNLAIRAGVCADCHIGNAARNMEVNHDLIAAGHPRLNFEYAGYLHMYARHWLMEDEKARHPDFHARVWAIGQIVSAKAAVEQLHGRAVAANKEGKGRKPWPEFAEYGCFACHKDLKVIKTGDPTSLAKYNGRLPGSLPFGTWYLPLTDTYAKLTGSNVSIEGLSAAMQKPGAPPAAVAAQAEKLIKELDRWSQTLGRGEPMTADAVRKLLEQLAGDAAKNANGLDWDKTAQFYLALSALNEGLADLDPAHDPKAVKKDLRALGKRLKDAFEAGYDSPVRFYPQNPPRLETQFKAIRDQLGKKSE